MPDVSINVDRERLLASGFAELDGDTLHITPRALNFLQEWLIDQTDMLLGRVVDQANCSHSHARRIILQGGVRVNGEVVRNPVADIPRDAKLDIGQRLVRCNISLGPRGACGLPYGHFQACRAWEPKG